MRVTPDTPAAPGCRPDEGRQRGKTIRIADGCTSGHGVSGIAQLAIGSFIAVTAMFGAGIITANLIYKRV